MSIPESQPVKRDFQDALEEGRATYAPKPVVFLSGLLARTAITWLPLILYLALYLWQRAFGWPGAELSADERELYASYLFQQQATAYVAAAWPFSIAFATWGLCLAYLRALSAFADLSVKLQTAQGPVRIGIHSLVNGVGFPVVGAWIAYLTLTESNFYRWLPAILLSGMVFNVCFRHLQNLFLRLFHRARPAALNGLALRLYVPRRVGFDAVRVAVVDIEGDDVRVEAYIPKEDRLADVEAAVAEVLPGKRVQILNLWPSASDETPDIPNREE